MKVNKDLQEQREFDKTDFTQADEKAYEILFKELSKEDELVINPEFAPGVIARINKKRRREQIKENFLFASAIILVIAITIAGLQFSKSILDTQQTLFSNKLVLPLLSMISMIVVFQVLDKMYIRNRKFRRLKEWRS